MKSVLTAILFFLVSYSAVQLRAQSQDDQAHIRPKNLPQPKEEPKPEQQGESSSKDSEINLEGPGRTPSSSGTNNGVHEMYPYDPHKAAKDLEVGQYYLKRKNYRAALDRFNEALLYKPNDAESAFYLAQTQEKLELFSLAYQGYRNYLNLSKDGPHLKEAQEAMKRIEPHLPAAGDGQPSSALSQLIQQGESDLAKNDFEAAHDSFAKAIQAVPDDPMVNFRLAQSLVGLERLDEARTYYKKYLSLQPNGKMAADAKREIAKINLVLGKL
jgi:Tfp pilus assembly protein PilF